MDARNGINLLVTGQSLIKRDFRTLDAEATSRLRELVSAHDVAFTSFEGVLRGNHKGWPTKETFIHDSDPEVLDVLKHLGFNALALANNHAFDLGSAGILSTLEEVNERDFLYGGTGENLTSASTPLNKEIGGKHVALVAMDCGPQNDTVYARDSSEHLPDRPGVNPLRVKRSISISDDLFGQLEKTNKQSGNEKRRLGREKVGYQKPVAEGHLDFFGASVRNDPETANQEIYEFNESDLARNLEAIKSAAKQADLVMVYAHHHHWMPDWEITPEWIQIFARQCIDAGANIFVSHGVPLLQGIEIYQQRPIFYGLGNFIFHTFRKTRYVDNRIWQSVAASCTFDDSGDLLALRLHPLALGGHTALGDASFELSRDAPQLVDGEIATEILKNIAQLSNGFGADIITREHIGEFQLRS